MSQFFIIYIRSIDIAWELQLEYLYGGRLEGACLRGTIATNKINNHGNSIRH